MNEIILGVFLHIIKELFSMELAEFKARIRVITFYSCVFVCSLCIPLLCIYGADILKATRLFME